MKTNAIRFALARIADRFDDLVARSELRKIDAQLVRLQQAQSYHTSLAQQCSQSATELRKDRMFLAHRIDHQDNRGLA